MKRIFVILLTVSFLFFQSSVYAIEENDITVEFNQQKLKSKLKRKYKGYEIVITNNNENGTEILNASVEDGLNGNIAYNAVEESPGGSVGGLWIVAGPMGLITFGIAWVIGIIETPILYFSVKHSNNKAWEESLKYTNKIELKILEKNDNITAYTLIPKKTAPALNLKIKDTVTLEQININKNSVNKIKQ